MYSPIIKYSNMLLFFFAGPPYASAIMVELKKSPDDQYFVSFSYRNETNRDPYDLILSNCPQECPLETFAKLTKSLRPENWIEECGIELDPTAQAVTVFSIGVSIVIAAILLGVIQQLRGPILTQF